MQVSTKTRLGCFLATFSLEKRERKKKIRQEKTEELQHKAKTRHKRDIQGRANNIRKGRQGLGGGGPLVHDGLACYVKATQKWVVLTYL